MYTVRLIFSARQVLSLGGLDDTATFNAPVFFNHIRFGAYYREIVMQAAQEQDLDPLLLLSLMRQESLFEGFIQSSAGANGLMQMIPTTAREAANNMGWPPGYLDQDIFRPYVNISLGSYHLRQQIDIQDGDMYAGLTRYNAAIPSMPGSGGKCQTVIRTYIWKLSNIRNPRNISAVLSSYTTSTACSTAGPNEFC